MSERNVLSDVMPDSYLGHKSGNLHLNNKNNQLER